jgi:hypothetical protein
MVPPEPIIVFIKFALCWTHVFTVAFPCFDFKLFRGCEKVVALTLKN